MEIWKKNNIVESSFHGEDGLLSENNSGIALTRHKYDKKGNWIETSFYGANEQFIIAEDFKYAIIHIQYDKKSNAIEESYYGSDEQLIINEEIGCALLRVIYDQDANAIEMRYYGSDEQLIINEEIGCAILRMKYDQDDNIIEERYYGSDEQLIINEIYGCAILRQKYNSDGNETEYSFYGSDNKLIINEIFGFASARLEFDENGNNVEERHYGVDNMLRENNEGVAILRWEYDENNEIAKTIGYDNNLNIIYSEAASNIVKAKAAEAKIILGQIIGLEKTYFFTNNAYFDFVSGDDCPAIGFAQPDQRRFNYSFHNGMATAIEDENNLGFDVNGDGDYDDGLTLTLDGTRDSLTTNLVW